MNCDTGKVITEDEFEKLPAGQKRDWTKFSIGEHMRVKGIMFEVHDVSEGRLVLKFVKK